MKNQHSYLLGLSITTLMSGTIALLSDIPQVFAVVIAEERAEFNLRNPIQAGEMLELKYRVSIEQARAPEKLLGVMANIKYPLAPPNSGVKEIQPMSVNCVDDFNCDVVFKITFDQAPQNIFSITTTAKEKFKNKLRKQNIMLNIPGRPPAQQPPAPKLPGFEFKSNSPGIYTLFNDSDEDWTVNRLLVRINESQIDLEDFDLENPDSFLWDFTRNSPFTLLKGESFDLPLGEVLLEDSTIFSQAFVEIIGNTTGETILDIQQHQHESIPESSVNIGILAFGALGVSQLFKRNYSSN